MVRYQEFNENIDKEDIRSLLYQNFKLEKGYPIISDNGFVNFTGDIKLKVACNALPLDFDQVEGKFSCVNNNLTTLIGSPRKVGGSFFCYDNQLTTLEGGPEYVEKHYNCSGNNLKSLNDGPTHVGRNFILSYNKDLPLLQLLKYELVMIKYGPDELQSIFNKHCKIGNSRSNIIQCQKELISAGFESNAKW